MACINPIYVLRFTGIRLPLENTLVSLQRLHSLAFGFETFAFRQKTMLSCLSTVFQEQPDISSNEISGINYLPHFYSKYFMSMRNNAPGNQH